MSLSLVLIYTPISIWFFYINVNIPLTTYRWDEVHNSVTSNSVVYLPAQGPYTFDHYIPGAMAIFVFVFFGMGEDATNIYQAISVKCGLGYCFPSLLRERRRSREEGKKTSWLGKLSLVMVGKKYFDKFSMNRSTMGSDATTVTDV
jgi:hypothetical protein